MQTVLLILPFREDEEDNGDEEDNDDLSWYWVEWVALRLIMLASPALCGIPWQLDTQLFVA